METIVFKAETLETDLSNNAELVELSDLQLLLAGGGSADVILA